MRYITIATALFLAFLPPSARSGSEEAEGPSKPQSQDAPSLESDNCDDASNLAQVQCLGRYIAFLDQELNRTYQLALKALPEQDKDDNRRSRKQLRKSERAWLLYKDEDCTLVGGVTGGSNLWVTHFAANCEVKRTRERIRFLRKLAAGQAVDE